MIIIIIVVIIIKLSMMFLEFVSSLLYMLSFFSQSSDITIISQLLFDLIRL